MTRHRRLYNKEDGKGGWNGPSRSRPGIVYNGTVVSEGGERFDERQETKGLVNLYIKQRRRE